MSTTHWASDSPVTAISIEAEGGDFLVRHPYGSLCATAHGECWTLDSIRVEPKARHCGIGTALLCVFLEHIDMEGDERPSYLWVGSAEAGRQGALRVNRLIRWYTKHGFALRYRHGTEILMVRTGKNGDDMSDVWRKYE